MRTHTHTFVIATLAASATLATAQPIEWSRAEGGNGHFYEYVRVEEATPWAAASLAANQRRHQGQRGHLVCITSPEENTFILERVVPKTIQEAWLGGSYNERTKAWEWVTREPWEYENWQAGAPNDNNANAGLAMVPGMQGAWNDEAIIFQVQGYIVEYDSGTNADGSPILDANWTGTFHVEKSELQSTGRNRYFVLEPGYTLEFMGPKGTLVITVLDETRNVNGVETRVVEERETEGGELVEVSRNFFAISRRTQSVYYFGEEVDVYESGEVVSHEGAWLAGENGAHFGMYMPGDALIGARYYQEIAPGVALDRAEVISASESITTPAGKFADCLKVLETSQLDRSSRDFKMYAPGVGLVEDGSLRLIRSSR